MRIKPNKSTYSNFEEGVSLSRKSNDLFNIVYFTDVHLGINGNFRSDSVTDAIIKKLEIIKKFSIEHTDCVICGGDLFDVPRFTNNLNPKYPAINFDILNYCVDFQNQTNMIYCLGNHDYVHGPDVDYNLKKSPISLIKVKHEPWHIFKSIQLFAKHSLTVKIGLIIKLMSKSWLLTKLFLKESYRLIITFRWKHMIRQQKLYLLLIFMPIRVLTSLMIQCLLALGQLLVLTLLSEIRCHILPILFFVKITLLM